MEATNQKLLPSLRMEQALMFVLFLMDNTSHSKGNELLYWENLPVNIKIQMDHLHLL